jgi:hypothetical protein
MRTQRAGGPRPPPRTRPNSSSSGDRRLVGGMPAAPVDGRPTAPVFGLPSLRSSLARRSCRCSRANSAMRRRSWVVTPGRRRSRPSPPSSAATRSRCRAGPPPGVTAPKRSPVSWIVSSTSRQLTSEGLTRGGDRRFPSLLGRVDRSEQDPQASDGDQEPHRAPTAQARRRTHQLHGDASLKAALGAGALEQMGAPGRSEGGARERLFARGPPASPWRASPWRVGRLLASLATDGGAAASRTVSGEDER